MKLADEIRPDIPPWDAREGNIEEWKRRSSMREGFDLAMTIFRPTR